MEISKLVCVALGGAIGSATRFAVSSYTVRFSGTGWPWGTFSVNLIGSFLMGLCVGWLAYRISGNGMMAVFLTTGILGGFTTFSAFSLEAANMVERKAYALAGVYAGSSVLFGMFMIFAGLFIARKVFA